MNGAAKQVMSVGVCVYVERERERPSCLLFVLQEGINQSGLAMKF